MLVRPEQRKQARRMLSSSIDFLEASLDDSWMRDNGPIFVRGADVRRPFWFVVVVVVVAVVDFGFNGWGEPTQPTGFDARVPELVASHLGVRRYVAPLVLEGGSFFVDGAGTLITTEQCLLHENRNPSLSREGIESALSEHLGIDAVVWLGEGHYEDFSTDGHIDDIAHFLAPGRVILHVPSNPAHPDHERAQDNARRLRTAVDARGQALEVIEFDTGDPEGIRSTSRLRRRGRSSPSTRDDGRALAQIRAVYPDREVVTVQSDVLFRAGGGGPHCITQQVPAGTFAS